MQKQPRLTSGVFVLSAMPVLALAGCSAGSAQPAQTVTVTAQPTAAPSTPANGGEVTTFGDGVYTVGVDIKPGTYRVTTMVPSGSTSCAWRITKSGSNGSVTLQNDIPKGGFPTVAVKVGEDLSVHDCGMWAIE